ncbi:MAG: hypothetical protein LBQ90_08750 [Synergistaceae bacterium]|jgi:hypothetical protein|nr:hypothetical protein [Synergistaceae bacterium]
MTTSRPRAPARVRVLVLVFFGFMFTLTLTKTCASEGFPATLPNISLPEAGHDLFVSERTEDHFFSASGGRFILRTPIIRPNFSKEDADSITGVLAGFVPAGGVASQSSRIYREGSGWKLEIVGEFSRRDTQAIVLDSVEVIYRNDFAEFVPFKRKMFLEATNAKTPARNEGGCNSGFGVVFLVMHPKLLRLMRGLRRNVAVRLRCGL